MPRPVARFSIPINETLENEKGWQAQDDGHISFLTTRFHFALFRVVDQNPEPYLGEPVDTILPKQGAKIATELGVTYTLTTTDTLKTIENAIVEGNLLASISGEIAGQLGVPNVASTSTKLTSQLQASIKQQFSSGLEFSRVVSTTEQRSFKQTFAFEGAESEPREALICPLYNKVSFDIHLTHIDHLTVEYRRRLLGLRKTRRKSPELGINGRPFNLHKIMLPLRSASVWQLSPSLAMKWRGEEYRTVDDPTPITDGPPMLQTTPAVDPPARPSLYHLSNAAFPTRWIKRKGPWTEDDLKRAEEDESQDSAWFWEYGPGRQPDAREA